MRENTILSHETIRMLFELDRVDDPQLYDDLIRFKKGTKRINRLRLLAREGVIGQMSLATAGAFPRLHQISTANGDAVERPAGPATPMPIASDVFDVPIVDH